MTHRNVNEGWTEWDIQRTTLSNGDTEPLDYLRFLRPITIKRLAAWRERQRAKDGKGCEAE